MKLLIFDVAHDRFCQQFCDLHRSIVCAVKKFSKVFTACSHGTLYIHELRNFSAIAMFRSIWEDISYLHAATDDILIGHNSGLVIPVPLKLYSATKYSG